MARIILSRSIKRLSVSQLVHCDWWISMDVDFLFFCDQLERRNTVFSKTCLRRLISKFLMDILLYPPYAEVVGKYPVF